MIIILTTVSDHEDGVGLADKIVGAKLAACVQILPQMTSIYVWEGELQKESEHLLLIKTPKEKYDELEKFIIANHSYDVPEVVAVETSNVSESYRRWLELTLSE